MANPLPDPSTLTDEELDKLLAGEEPEAEEEQPAAPAEDEAAPEAEVTEEEEEPEAPEVPEQHEEEAPKPPSRREQLRIQQILEKYGQPQQTPATPTVTPKGLDYEQELDADPELIKKLTADRQATTTEAYSEGLKQARNIQWNTLLQVDTPAVQASHPQLNPKDETNFHPGINNAVNSFYLAMSGWDKETGLAANTDIRYADFVDSVYELAEEIAAHKVQDTRKQVARQAAKTGIRPNGTQAKKLNLNKAPQDMTDEELDAFLEQQGVPVAKKK